MLFVVLFPKLLNLKEFNSLFLNLIKFKEDYLEPKEGTKTKQNENITQNEINPKYSIISVGKNNRYGHPNKEVLDNLENSKIYRTDEDGSIMFKIKNNKLGIETCSP